MTDKGMRWYQKKESRFWGAGGSDPPVPPT